MTNLQQSKLSHTDILLCPMLHLESNFGHLPNAVYIRSDLVLLFSVITATNAHSESNNFESSTVILITAFGDLTKKNLCI